MQSAADDDKAATRRAASTVGPCDARWGLLGGSSGALAPAIRLAPTLFRPELFLPSGIVVISYLQSKQNKQWRVIYSIRHHRLTLSVPSAERQTKDSPILSCPDLIRASILR